MVDCGCGSTIRFLQSTIHPPPSSPPPHPRFYERSASSRAKHKVDGANQTPPRPDEVHLEWLLHVQDRKRDKHPDRDHLLQDLELPQRHGRIADPVGRDLE